MPLPVFELYANENTKKKCSKRFLDESIGGWSWKGGEVLKGGQLNPPPQRFKFN